MIEDDPPNARLMVALLDNVECDVRVAHSAEEALVVLGAFPAQVIVVDLVLPSMSGLVLAARLRQSPDTRDCLLIGVSSLDSRSTERLALEAGCDAYIEKPIRVATFATAITRLFRRKSGAADRG